MDRDERSLSSRRLALRIGGPLFLLVMDEEDGFAVQSKWCIGVVLEQRQGLNIAMEVSRRIH
ncbi:hypothetical protein GT3570_02165 [Geobacillus thermoleovorans]|nr:hypothetical protein GT3570_02165 [Geobacillus thermoleovorans]